MDKIVYYYKTVTGRTYFSNGNIKEEHKLGQYLRMLHYAKYQLEPLYLDKPEDFEIIKRVFNIPEGKTWKEVYNEI